MMHVITNPDFIFNCWVILLSFLFFYVLATPLVQYLSTNFKTYNHLNKLNQMQWCSRGVSTLHATITTIICSYVLFYDVEGYEDPFWGKSILGELASSFTYGYMLADFFYLVFELSPATSDAYYASILHHFMFIVCEPFLLVNGAMTHLAVVRLLAEMSTPFVNFRWNLAISSMKKSKWYFYNGITLLLTFFISRIAMLPYCYQLMLFTDDNDGYEKLGKLKLIFIGPIIVDFLNIFWFYRIAKGAFKHFWPSAISEAN